MKIHFSLKGSFNEYCSEGGFILRTGVMPMDSNKQDKNQKLR